MTSCNMSALEGLYATGHKGLPKNYVPMLAAKCCFSHRIGSGSQGEVWLAHDHATGQRMAVKLLRVSHDAQAELIAHHRLRCKDPHPNILALNFYIADRFVPNNLKRLLRPKSASPSTQPLYPLSLSVHLRWCRWSINMSFPLCKVDLLEHVLRAGSLGDHEASNWTSKLCKAVEHLHTIGIVHLDIKLENAFIDFSDELKLGDLGLAAYSPPGTHLVKTCGSGVYAAPEVLLCKQLGPYDGRAADIWSVGVCSFTMVHGRFPFEVSVAVQMLRDYNSDMRQAHASRTPYPMPQSALTKALQRKALSSDHLQLLDACLNVDAAVRKPISEINGMNWFNTKPPKEQASAEGTADLTVSDLTGYFSDVMSEAENPSDFAGRAAPACYHQPIEACGASTMAHPRALASAQVADGRASAVCPSDGPFTHNVTPETVRRGLGLKKCLSPEQSKRACSSAYDASKRARYCKHTKTLSKLHGFERQGIKWVKHDPIAVPV